MYNRYIIDNNFYKVGLEIRLSREDGDDAESESITNQRTFLLQVLASLNSLSDNKFELVDVYIDDGYSGLNFNRPGFRKMIADIEQKRINLVISKDLSRLGRDYIETGYYIEKYFPTHNIRYIAVNDNIDTFNDKSEGADMMPFRLSMNDMYAKDISKKVRTNLLAMKKEGKFASSTAPYGYIKDPENKYKLIPDPDTAPVVKEIFDLYIAGYGSSAIAEILTTKNIPTPVLVKNISSRLGRADHPEIWKHTSVSHIIKNRVYLGELIQHTFQNINYKTKKRRKLPVAEWIITENAHEPLIDRKTFELAQTIKNKSNTYSSSRRNEEYLLGNLIYCKDCGSKMSISYERKRDRITMNCNNYRKFSRYGFCFSHYLNYAKVEKTVFSKIALLNSLCSQSDILAKHLKNHYADPSKEVTERINATKIKIERLKRKIDSLYEDKFDALISAAVFKRLSENTDKEIKQLQKKLGAYIEEKKTILGSTRDTVDYKKIATDFLAMKKPTKEMINKIIKKIYVTKDRKLEINYAIKDSDFLLP